MGYTRRRLVTFMSMLVLQATPTGAQVTPFRLLVVREKDIASLLGINDCIVGRMYNVDEFTSITEMVLGQPLAHNLELPFRNNLNEISAVPPGEYKGSIRTDGSLGWRIELTGTEPRKFIQIHPGNFTRQILGCILVGLAAEPAVDPQGPGGQQGCTVQQSRDAISRIRVRYGSDPTRSIEVKIIDE